MNNTINSANAVTINGGSLDVVTFNNTVASVSLQSGSINGGGGTLTSNTTYDLQSGSVSANLAGAVGVTKTTGGTVTLSGVNTFDGPVNVNGGVLSFAASANLGNAAVATNVVVINGATLQYTGAGAVDLTSNRVVTIGVNSATIEATVSSGVVTQVQSMPAARATSSKLAPARSSSPALPVGTAGRTTSR